MGLGKLKRQDKQMTIMGVKKSQLEGKSTGLLILVTKSDSLYRPQGPLRGRPQITGASGMCWIKLEGGVPVTEVFQPSNEGHLVS